MPHNFSIHTFLFLLCFFIGATSIFGQPNNTIKLFTVRSDLTAAAPLPVQEKSHTYIRMHPSLTKGPSLTAGDRLEMRVGGEDRLFLVTRVSQITEGTWSVIARGDVAGHNLLSFTMEGNRILGSLNLYAEGTLYRLKYDQTRQSNYLAQLNYGELDILSCPSVPAPAGSDTQLPRRERHTHQDPRIAADQHNRIDLMFVYTRDAKEWMEDHSSTNAFIAEIVNRSQVAVDNSNIDFEFNLVHSTQTNYDEPDFGSSQTLRRLTYTNDGYMDNVHNLRNTHDADLVAMLADVSDVGGIAWLMNSPSGRPQYGFSLNRVQQLHYTYTLAHEIGHNMGNHHSRNQRQNAAPASGGLNDYSTGWRWTGNNGLGYVSVMTYEEGDIETPYFSNPDVNYQGTPTGSYNGPYAPADNARSMREIKDEIADYRINSNPPPATPGLDDPPDGALGITRTPILEWNTASRADQYQVQVSTSSEFSSLVIDQTHSGTSFKVSNALDYVTQYHWRVRASNAAGNSNWSQVWDFTTTIATPELTSPGDGQDALPRRPQFQWSAVQHADTYRIQISKDPGFGNTVVDTAVNSNTFQPVSFLDYLTTYHWRVKARNKATGIQSNWTPTRSFETVIEPPEQVTTVAPVDMAIQQSVNPSLLWNSSPRAAEYTLQVATSKDFEQMQYSGVTTDTAYTVTEALDYATRYYWRIQASNEGGTGGWSEPKVLTTIVDKTAITMNYPNPFQGKTTIRYQLAMETDARLEVFNTIGRQVRLLVDKRQEPRIYEFEFDGSDLASGVYIVRLVTDNTMEVLLMTRIR